MMMTTQTLLNVPFTRLKGPAEVDNDERNYLPGDLVRLPDGRLATWVGRTDQPGIHTVSVDDDLEVEVMICHGGDLRGLGIWIRRQPTNRQAPDLVRRLGRDYNDTYGQPYSIITELVW